MEEDASNYTPYVPVRERKLEKLSKLGAKIYQTKKTVNDSSDSEKDEKSEDEEDPQALARKENISLLDQHTELKRMAEGKISIPLPIDQNTAL